MSRCFGQFLVIEMSCRGVFFAITAEQAAPFQEANDDDTLMGLVEDVEQAWDEDNLAECDKAWDAMHRLLTDGTLEFGAGSEPLCHCVLGPHQLHDGDDYIVSLVSPDRVKAVAQALIGISETSFRDKYRTLVPQDYSPEDADEDREYTWEYFQAVRELYRKAAERERFVLFTVDQ